MKRRGNRKFNWNVSFVHASVNRTHHTECGTSENKQHTLLHGHMPRMLCVYTVHMCKIKSVKNEMLNSSYKNNVNELFWRRYNMHRHAHTNTHTVRTCASHLKCTLLIYYTHIFYIFIYFTLHRISQSVCLCFNVVFIFLLLFTYFGRLQFFNEMRKLYSARTHTYTHTHTCVQIFTLQIEMSAFASIW